MKTADPWVAVVEAELHLAIFDGYVTPTIRTPDNAREYNCSHVGCDRRAVAKGLCNLHYTRRAKGSDLNAPNRRGPVKTICRICGESTSKGGWSLCKKHYRNIRRVSVKKTLVRLLGGACISCSAVYPISVFDFHHIDDNKEHGVSTLIASDAPIVEVVAEARKCSLLCANCHRIEHHEDDI